MDSRFQTVANIILALAFIAIATIFSSSINRSAKTANTEFSELTSTDYDISVYNQALVPGTNVIELAKQPKSVGSSIARIIVVTTGNELGCDYSEKLHPNIKYSANGSSAEKYSECASAMDKNYINPKAMFKSYYYKDENEVITGILFIQEDADVKASSFTGKF